MKKLFLVRPFPVSGCTRGMMKGFNDALARSISAECGHLKGFSLVVASSEISAQYTAKSLKQIRRHLEVKDVHCPLEIVCWSPEYQTIFERLVYLGESCDNMILFAHDELITKGISEFISHFSKGKILGNSVQMGLTKVFSKSTPKPHVFVSGSIVRFDFARG